MRSRSIGELLTFQDPKGTVMESSSAPTSRIRNPARASVPHKLGHVAFHVTEVKHTTKFIATCWVFASRTGWATSSRSCAAVPTNTINLMQTGSNRHFTRLRAARLGHMQTACDFLSVNGYNCCGGRAATASPQPVHLSSQPAGLITELFAELDRMNEELGYFEPRPWHRDNPQRPKVWAKTRRLLISGHHAGRGNAQVVSPSCGRDGTPKRGETSMRQSGASSSPS